MIGGEAIKNSLSAHPPVPVTRVPRSVSGACWPDECSPRSAAFPPHSPPSTARFCSNDSSVLCRCPTPRLRACGSYGLSLHPPSCCWLAAGVSEVSRFSCMKLPGVSGVYDYAGPSRNLRYRSRPCCLPPMQKRQRPDCIFSELNTQPTCTPVYASPNTSRCATQNSGPSGSLLLSRRTLSFPASCRFIPAHCIGDLAQVRDRTRWRRTIHASCVAYLVTTVIGS
jgi:hypothetical protein